MTKQILYNGKWNEIGIREKMQIVNGTALTFAAIVLYFVAFIVTLTIHYPIISAGIAFLGAGLAYFGITAFVKGEMISFKTTIDDRIQAIEDKEKEQQKHNNQRKKG